MMFDELVIWVRMEIKIENLEKKLKKETKEYLEEKLKKKTKKPYKLIIGISLFGLAALVTGTLLFKKVEKNATLPASNKSYISPREFYDTISYFILNNKPVKYPNLEVIVKHYPASEPFIPMVKKKIEEHKDIFYLNPVVVLGLINAESGFDPYAVSVAGAAGLMQLIPETAQEMGLKIYEGNLDIYQNLKKARRNKIKRFDLAVKAGKREDYEEFIRLFKEYNFYARKTNSLFQEYKKTLLENKDLDERLDPEKNIWGGMKYFAILAKSNMENPNIANLRNIIAAYNFRGEDAAEEWTLPIIREPINHVNIVIEFYRRFRSLAMRPPKI